LNERQKLYIDLLSSNLEELASSCDSGFASQMLVLTPAETEVANFIRHGRTTKEIASLMNISIRTAEMHRLNIRRKLGIHGKRSNLRTFLLSM
jgi:DNA-binding CsgD family transcriptional regulator